MKNLTNFLIINALGLITFSFLSNVYADGTKQLRPIQSDKGYVCLYKGGGNQNYNQFAMYNAGDTNRLYVTVCDTSERIYLGFNTANTGIKFRVRRPDGTFIYGGAVGVTIPTSGNGYITSYAQAVAGPTPIVGAGGYAPITIIPNMIGNYYIEFDYNITGNGDGQQKDFELFDITVGKSGIAKIGRVWSKAWLLTTRLFQNPYKGNMYVYSNDGITYKVEFNGIKPYVFTISANVSGCTNTGNPDADRASRIGNQIVPQYRVFLTDPDSVCFPTGSYGNITSPTFIDGCTPDSFCIVITVDKPGQVEVYLELNGIPGHQSGTADKVIQANVVAGSNCVPWDGKDGLGNYVASNTLIKITVKYNNGLTHMPMYDVERHPNGFIVKPVRPLKQAVALYWDDSTNLSFDGGTKNILVGCTDTISGCHPWPYNDLNEANTGFGNQRTINTWWEVPTQINIDSFYYTVNYIAIDFDVDDTTTLSGDKTVCLVDSLINLNVEVIKAQGGTWHSMPGTFNPPVDTTTGGFYVGTYKPTNAEIASGSVTLVMTTYGNGDCPPVTDSMTVTFNYNPSVNAGPNDTVCNTVGVTGPVVQLNGSAVNATGGIVWTGGTGTYSPNNNTLNAIYYPSVAERTAGKATLVLKSLGYGVCSQAIDTLVIIINPLPSNVDAGPNQPICLGDTAQLNATGSGGSISWTPTANLSNPAILNPKAWPSVTTKYYMTITTAEGCSLTDSVTVTVNPLPTADAGNNAEICSGDMIQLQGSGGTSYTWSPGATLNDSNIQKPVATPIITTTYTVTVSDGNNCKDQDTVRITVNPLPTADAGNDTTITCLATVDLFATATGGTPGYNYQWSGVGGPAAQAWNNRGAGTYTITVTDSKGCKDEDQVTVSLTGTTLTLFTSGSDTICEGESTTISASDTGGIPTITYTWSDGLPSNGGPHIVTPTSTHTYDVQITDGAGCQKTGFITITVNPVPAADAGPNATICLGESVQLDGEGGLFYEWTPQTWLNAWFAEDPIATPLSTGTFTYYVSVSNGLGCSDTDSVSITVNPIPTADAGSDETICIGDVIPLNATGGTNGYSWSPATGLDNTTIANPNASPTVTTEYIVTVTNTFNCTDNDTIIINVNELPIVSTYGDTLICPGDFAMIGAYSGGAVSYTWSPSAGLTSSNVANPIATPASSTVYIVSVEDTNGCVNTGSVSVTLSPINADFTVEDICLGQVASFADVSAGTINDWLWNLGNGIFTKVQNPTYGFDSIGMFTVVLSVEDIYGCEDTVSHVINVTGDIYVDAMPDTAVILGESLELYVASNGMTCNWSPDIYLDDAGQPNPITTPFEDITYTVICTDIKGCKGVDTVRVLVKEDCSYYVPDAFTPNGDNVNDVVFIEGFCIEEIDWKIYDRWGELMFESFDKDLGWDGTHKGEPCEMGTYGSYATIRFYTKNKTNKNGEGNESTHPKEIFWKHSISLIK